MPRMLLCSLDICAVVIENYLREVECNLSGHLPWYPTMRVESVFGFAPMQPHLGVPGSIYCLIQARYVC